MSTVRGILMTTALLSALAWGQGGSPLSGPTPGFVFDAPTASIRAVVGSLGSATLAAPLVSKIEFGSVAPHGDFAVTCALRQCFVASGLSSGAVTQTPIAGAFETSASETPEGAAWSADGSVAVLFSTENQWIQVVGGLPGAALASSKWDIASLGGKLASVAVSPDGKKVTIAIAGDHSGVFEVTDTGSFVPLLNAASALAFSGDGATLYALDGQTMTELSMSTGLAQSWPISGLTNPVGLQAGRNASGQAVVYLAGDKTLVAYDAAQHTLIEQTDLSFAPTQLQPMGASFLLTSRNSTGDVLWSYTTGRGVYFVPVPPATASDTIVPQQQRRAGR